MDKLIVNQASTPNELSQLTGEVLRDLARNESASREIRKAAVEQLLEKESPFANLAELRELVLQIRAEQDAHKEVSEVVAAAVAEISPKNELQPNIIYTKPGEEIHIVPPKPAENPALKASVTTQTMMQFEGEDGA